jgi:hypothetical protein
MRHPYSAPSVRTRQALRRPHETLDGWALLEIAARASLSGIGAGTVLRAYEECNRDAGVQWQRVGRMAL